MPQYAPGTAGFDQGNERRSRHAAQRAINISDLINGVGVMMQGLGKMRRGQQEEADQSVYAQRLGQMEANPEGPPGQMDTSYSAGPGASPIPMDPNAPEAQGRDIGSVQSRQQQRSWGQALGQEAGAYRPSTLLERGMGLFTGPQPGRLQPQAAASLIGQAHANEAARAATAHQGRMAEIAERNAGSNERRADAAETAASWPRGGGGITPYQQATMDRQDAGAKSKELQTLTALEGWWLDKSMTDRDRRVAIATKAGNGTPIPSLTQVQARLTELRGGQQQMQGGAQDPTEDERAFYAQEAAKLDHVPTDEEYAAMEAAWAKLNARAKLNAWAKLNGGQ